MKKIIYSGIMVFLIYIFSVAAASKDFYVRDFINISSHLTNPQAIEAIPGGFIIIDWEGGSSMAYVIDSEGKLLNQTNAATPARFNLSDDISDRVTSIRAFNYTDNDRTYIMLDNTGKRVLRVNATNLSRHENSKWFAPSPGNFSSTDNLAGMCTNLSLIHVAMRNRDVVNTLGGVNSSVNQSGEYSIPGTDNAGGFDCLKNGSITFILDDVTSIVHLTQDGIPPTVVYETVNMSNLTGLGLNSFSDIAALSELDFYVISNISKVAYHVNKRQGLETYSPNMTFTFPNRNQAFLTRFPTLQVQLNFSVAQGNDSRSQFNAADRINCSLMLNSTYNTSVFASNNLSRNTTINVTFSPGSFLAQIKCKANNTYAREQISGPTVFSVGTYRHVLWMGDNFSVWYNSVDKQIEAVLGNDSALLTAPFNITSNDPVSIRVTWNNATGNRTLYVDGAQRASDLRFGWTMPKETRIYLGSRNDTGQLNGAISMFQSSNTAKAPSYQKGQYINSWTLNSYQLLDKIKENYFFQYRATLRRGITSDKPVLKFVNISFDETLMNQTFAPGVSNLDFAFASASSSAAPLGQSASVPIITIWNRGNVTFDLQVVSLTPFDPCFSVRLYNQSGGGLSPGNSNNTVNLSTTAQTIAADFAPGKNASVWMNVTASSCSGSSEFFDIKFSTSP